MLNCPKENIAKRGIFMEKDPKANDNVIPFPQLELRLLNKGRLCLEEGNVKEAIEYLEEAKRIDDENPEILFTLTIAYVQQGNFSNAKLILEEMMRFGIGDYFEVVELYVTVLFQLHEYKKINTLLTMLLDEEQIPEHKLDQYRELLQLSQKLADEQKKKTNRDPKELFKGDFQKVLQNILELDLEDVHTFIHEIESFLRDDSKDAFVKTMIINALKEKGFERKIQVRKFNKSITLNPSSYFSVQDVPFSREVKQYIEKALRDDNPSLLENALTLCENFFFAIYPLEKEMTNPLQWAIAILAITASYFDQNLEEMAFIKTNAAHISEAEVEEAKAFVLHVEEHFMK